MNAATILPDFAGVDIITSVPVLEIKGSQLRAGMLLVDELDTPVAGLDHKVRATRSSGAVAFFAHDFERGGFTTITIGANSTVRVAAR